MWLRTAYGLTHVEDSSQATFSRKGFDQDVVHCLRNNVDERADWLLFSATYGVNNDASWRMFCVIIVNRAYAFYRIMYQRHLTKKQNNEHSSKPSISSASMSMIIVACPETRLMITLRTNLDNQHMGQNNTYNKRIESHQVGHPLPTNASPPAGRYKSGDGRDALHE